MQDLSLLTWEEIRGIDKEKSIVFAVLAPIEEHGKHLPLATDIIEGQYWSLGASRIVRERSGAECYCLPPFPVASASVNGFYGSIHFTMKTTFEVAYGILESLRSMGFLNIIIIASHADPEHLIAVEKAVRKINGKYGVCAFAPMGQIFMGEGVKMPPELELFEKEHGDDYHAGWIETSSLLAMDKGMVRKGYGELPDSRISDRDMISKKRQLAAMGEYGHLGSPRLATEKLGSMLNDNCIGSIADAVLKFYNRDGYQRYEHYSLYKILPLHLGFIGAFGRVRRKKVTE
ncbi:MAG: creatininase family protein [Clostridiales bacterium]|nr:creatininase family protein [Clostridiales bacterium]